MSEGKFDLRVHIRDKKTGRVEKVQPYKLVIDKGERRFYRGGVEFYGNGVPVNPEEAAKMAPVMTLDEKRKEEMKTILKAEIIAELKAEASEERKAKALAKKEAEELKLKEDAEAAEVLRIEAAEKKAKAELSKYKSKNATKVP